jgi:hypothetical protein
MKGAILKDRQYVQKQTKTLRIKILISFLLNWERLNAVSKEVL